MTNCEDSSEARVTVNSVGQSAGAAEQSRGIHADPSYVHLVGAREELKLDGRFRFRLPDQLAGRLQQEMGRVQSDSKMPPGAFQRLSFYFVPGPNEQILLYPPTNIEIAIDRFQNPVVDADPAQIRAARDYFYSRMEYVEADKQNRLVIPEHLREHAGLDEDQKEVLLNGHGLWLVLRKSSLAAEREANGKEAMNQVGGNILDPIR